jgi:NAD(P)-dependent dehydrogenase (short-subunit alcohol dehydrogenase family)
VNKMKIKSVLVTGASAGIGKEVARQLALKPDIETIYLACRNEQRALMAKQELERKTGRNIFKILVMDVSRIASVLAALSRLKEPIDAIVMNAGGFGGEKPMRSTEDGVTELFAQNVLGHVVILERLLSSGQLTQAAIFVGSEAARGVSKIGIKRPASSSSEEFGKVISGSAYVGKPVDVFSAYGEVKQIGTLWMSQVARRHPELRILTISPGGTSGTQAANSQPVPIRLFYNHIFLPILGPMLGLVHSLETGGARIVNGLFNDSLLSGHFYACKANTLTGRMIDQQEIMPSLGDPVLQRMASEAIFRVLPAGVLKDEEVLKEVRE